MTLLKQWLNDGEAPRPELVRWLMSCGVELNTLLHDPGFEGFLLSEASIVFDGNRFDFSSERPECEGRRAVLFIARDSTGNADDLIAWSPKTGDLASYFGCASVLGAQNINAPRFGDPLSVHADPLAWLRAGRHGVTIVDPRQARRELDGVGPFLTTTVADGVALKKILTHEIPEIKVAIAAREAA